MVLPNLNKYVIIHRGKRCKSADDSRPICTVFYSHSAGFYLCRKKSIL